VPTATYTTGTPALNVADDAATAVAKRSAPARREIWAGGLCGPLPEELPEPELLDELDELDEEVPDELFDEVPELFDDPDEPPDPLDEVAPAPPNDASAKHIANAAPRAATERIVEVVILGKCSAQYLPF
jgi:hypothetical protein